MGRHVNGDGTVDDEAAAAEQQASQVEQRPRHAAGAPLEPRNVISPDTHVGVDLDAAPAGAADAAASPARPDELIERGRVGDGHELE
jgi:hypothetical protein